MYNTLQQREMFPITGFVVDAACGTGRWMQILTEHAIPTIGFDLSRDLLDHTGNLSVIRGNLLQIPFQSKSASAITSLFSSFGYFASSELDYQQLSEFSRILKPNGWLLLDTAPIRTLDTLVVENLQRFSDGSTAKITRRREDNVVIKTILLDSDEYWEEHLRIYDSDTLDRILFKIGFELSWRIGDYDNKPFNETDSPRMIGCYVRRD